MKKIIVVSTLIILVISCATLKVNKPSSLNQVYSNLDNEQNKDFSPRWSLHNNLSTHNPHSCAAEAGLRPPTMK
jgi:hypothetical protein